MLREASSLHPHSSSFIRVHLYFPCDVEADIDKARSDDDGRG
jgi:hypothetical protein